MCILLTKKQIKDALPKIEKGLKKYIAIRSKLSHPGIFNDPDFRRAFNSYYRVRGDRYGREWQDFYYGLMEHAQKSKLQFEDVLDLLYQKTKWYEASFASKLVATLKDSLQNLSYYPDCTDYQIKGLN